MTHTTTSSVTKLQRVDQNQKRKFDDSDHSGTQTQHFKQSPERKMKTQASPVRDKRPADIQRASSGVLAMEESELYEVLQLGRKVGSGNWATVYEARIKRDGHIKAVKLVARCPDGVFTEAARQRFDALKKEYRILRTIPSHVGWHSNIIRHDCFISTPLTGCLVAPLHDEPMTVCLPLRMLQAYCLKLASALEWLHRHHICHNDVKLANIVVDRTPEDLIGEPIIIDFGFATDHRPGTGTDFWTRDKMGTAEYLSPERAAGRMHDERLSDIWALGVSVFEMATGRTPFEKPDEGPCNEQTMGEYRRRIAADEWSIDEDLPSDLVDLCRLMVHKNPLLRLSLAEVPHHRFFHHESESETESENDISDQERLRHSLKERLGSYASSLEEEAYTSPTSPLAAPPSLYSHPTNTTAESSLNFPRSPGLNLNDLSFEANQIKTGPPCSISTDTSQGEKAHPSTNGHAHGQTSIRTAAEPAGPIDIQYPSKPPTPQSRQAAYSLAPQSATPLRSAVLTASHKAKILETVRNKAHLRDTMSTVKRAGEENSHRFVDVTNSVAHGKRGTAEGSPKPGRLLTPALEEFLPDLVFSAQRAERLLASQHSARAHSVMTVDSDVGSISTECSSVDSSLHSHDHSHDENLGQGTFAAVQVSWNSEATGIDHNETQNRKDLHASFLSSIDSSAAGDGGGLGEPTVVLSKKGAYESSGTSAAIAGPATTTEASAALRTSSIEPSWREADADQVSSLLSRLDLIERLARETREQLSVILCDRRQADQPESTGALLAKKEIVCNEESLRVTSRQSLSRHIVTPNLAYDADCETEHGGGHTPSDGKESIGASVSLRSSPRIQLIPPIDTSQHEACHTREVSPTLDVQIEASLSSSCSRLSVLGEDEQEVEERTTAPPKRPTAAVEDNGSSTPRSARHAQPPPSSFSRSLGRIPLRLPAHPANHIEGSDFAINDKENHFVIVTPSSGALPLFQSGSGPTKLKRSFSNFRGRRTPSHDEREGWTAKGNGILTTTANASNPSFSGSGVGVGGGGGPGMNHSRSKSATLSSLFSFNMQQQQQQQHHKSDSIDLLHPAFSTIKNSHSTTQKVINPPLFSTTISTRTPTPAKGLARRRIREGRVGGGGGTGQTPMTVAETEKGVAQTPKESGSLWKRLVPSKTTVSQRTI